MSFDLEFFDASAGEVPFNQDMLLSSPKQEPQDDSPQSADSSTTSGLIFGAVPAPPDADAATAAPGLHMSWAPRELLPADGDEDEDESPDSSSQDLSPISVSDATPLPPVIPGQQQAQLPQQQQQATLQQQQQQQKPAGSSAAQPGAPSSGRQKLRASANLPQTPAEVLPTGLALPACLGGKMPAPSRKRKRKHSPESDGEDSDDPSRLAVRLPRDTLLALSSAQMSRYVRYMRESQKLSPAQQKELKQQKRLVKNRESARLSRQRKQDHISTLEGQISELRQEMEALRGQNQALLQENQRILLSMQKMQLDDRRALQQPVTAAMPQPSPYGEQQLRPSHAEYVPSRTLRAAGVCLFVIMFSFGLFFRASPDMDAGVVIKREVISPARTGAAHVFGDLAGLAGARSARGLMEAPEVFSVHGDQPQNEDEQLAADVFGPSWASEAAAAAKAAGLGVTWSPSEHVPYIVAPDASRLDPPPCAEPCPQRQSARRSRFGLLVPLRSLRAHNSSAATEQQNQGPDVFAELLCRVEQVNWVPRTSFRAAAGAPAPSSPAPESALPDPAPSNAAGAAPSPAPSSS